MSREFFQRFVTLRRNHAAWLLLASKTGPLVLASLKALFDQNSGGVELEAAVEHLASGFAEFANDTEFELTGDSSLTARRMLREWIRREVIVERNGQLLATDALQRAFHFLESLDDQPMTSTASRLATVQFAIENLEAQLSPNQSSRAKSLQDRIDSLTNELTEVLAGSFDVLDGAKAEEGIREVFQLADSLQADFRRVEDSYRDADRVLRQRIISEKQNRGEIVDELLSGHDALVQTPEGQVFESFHQQLVKTAELEKMKSRLRSILSNKNADRALKRKQKADLLLLVSRLVEESERVIQARARSERDVRSFLKSGLVDEQLRVGALLQDIFHAALRVDWGAQVTRRAVSPLPPIAVATAYLALVERLLIKQIENGASGELDLAPSEADLSNMDDEFWQAYNCMDRARLFESTVGHLRVVGRPLTIGELAKALPPTHDLETLAYWLAMARQAGIALDNVEEIVELFDERDGWTRFNVPHVEMTQESVAGLDSGSLE